jgi:hypothetical protein
MGVVMKLEEQIKFMLDLTKRRTLELIKGARSASDEQEMAEIDALKMVTYSLTYLQDIQTIIENHVK